MNNYIEQINYLSQIVGKFNASESQRSYQSRTMALGVRFSEKLKSVSSIEDLSVLMIKGNQAAFAMGVPEFSSQINNLGEIKKVEILSKQGKLQSEQRASLLRRLYGETLVLSDDKYGKLSDTKEFQQVDSLAPELQADAYKYIYETMQTKVQGVVEYLGSGNFGYSEYAINSRDSKPTQISHYLPTKGGKYDDALKSGLQILDEPFQITQAKGQMLEKREMDSINFGQQMALLNAQEDKAKRLKEWEYQFEEKKQTETYTDPNKWAIYEKKLDSATNNAALDAYDLFATYATSFGNDAVKKKINQKVFLKQNKNGEALLKFMQSDEDAVEFLNDLKENTPSYYSEVSGKMDLYSQTNMFRFLEQQKRKVYEPNTPTNAITNTYTNNPAGTKEKY